MGDDCVSLQADEVEALTSIYGDDWCVVDDTNRTYCIKIADDSKKLCLQVTFPSDYPLASPPFYQLNGPWLRGNDRTELCNRLENIYLENLGESIIYMWVECIRDYILSSSRDDSTLSGKVINISEEVDDYIEEEEDEITFHEYVPFDHSINDCVSINSTKQEFECPTIYHGNSITERRSTFQGHLAPIFFKEQISLVMERLCENKKVANATHNILAYRICREDSKKVIIQGCDDDGETNAGSRLLHLLNILDAENVIVIVSRWFGGILLGPDRFRLINNTARNILEEQGYIKVEKKLVKGSRK